MVSRSLPIEWFQERSTVAIAEHSNRIIVTKNFALNGGVPGREGIAALLDESTFDFRSS